MLKSERAFQQEVILLIAGSIGAFLLVEARLERTMLIGVLVLLLVVETINSAIEATIERIYGVDAVWGRGIRVRVERDDEDIPHRLWLWRSLVGGQRTDREGFSGQQRLVSE